MLVERCDDAAARRAVTRDRDGIDQVIGTRGDSGGESGLDACSRLPPPGIVAAGQSDLQLECAAEGAWRASQRIRERQAACQQLQRRAVIVLPFIGQVGMEGIIGERGTQRRHVHAELMPLASLPRAPGDAA